MLGPAGDIGAQATIETTGYFGDKGWLLRSARWSRISIGVSSFHTGKVVGTD